ncbi:methyltransferase [Streptomyces sp. HUCO-GS316]|uniref:methyltransferase n=1 Tax=Streptomyces sp. HUCO-GS316 TaxID=2692198 RepID=UPI0013712EBD|nr:methyltransferase [Streptomyces sp. HUCO-GS316]MXM68925.1 methyltransferase [Streptomyces sp. HUCO-GS316]
MAQHDSAHPEHLPSEGTRPESAQPESAQAPHPRALGLWEMADLVTPMAVRVAATHRVADHITDGRVTAYDIARAEGLRTQPLERVLRHLVTVGVLTADGGTYGLTELGQGLRADHPSRQLHLIDLGGAIGRGDLCLVDLPHVVRTGDPAYPVRYGLPYWDDLEAHPELAESFDRVMADNVARDARSIAAAYDWSSLGHVYDLGGGNGVLLAGLLTAHPTLRGAVVDLPATAARAAQRFRAAGLGDRAGVVGGSFFDELPTDGGGYILSSVLHNWADNEALRILERCAEAVAGGDGRVFVVEETGESAHTGMDLRMLAYYGGLERPLDEITRLARAAGLEVAGVHRAGGQATAVRSIVELVPEGRAH